MEIPNEKFFSFTDNLFTFDSYSCDCVTDVENIRPGVIKETIKIQGLEDKPVRFAFTPSRGMVRLSKSGSINSEHILTELLSIPDGDTKRLFAFFKEYGFFFPVSLIHYEAINMNELHVFINRIKAIVRLMSALGETRKDYKKLLGLFLYLQVSKPISFHFECFGDQPISTCEHALFSELSRATAVPSLNLTTTPFETDSYRIPDTIFNPEYELSIEEYTNIVGGFDTTNPGAAISQLYKGITRLYCNSPNLSYELRNAVDLLFHFQHSIAVIKEFSASGDIEFYDTGENVKYNYAKNFNDRMKESLISIAKATVRDEIGHNLYGMRPRYDVKMMAPAWEIQDLLTGIYVSIFFMRPGIELYRKCANPSCDRSFLVSTTSSKRKYCCYSCRNAAAQRAHRMRKQSDG